MFRAIGEDIGETSAKVAIATFVDELEKRGYVIVPKEPTKVMLRAACKSMSPGKRPTFDFVSVVKKHAIRYKAMIEAGKIDL